ncbi:hypothetical protein CYY_006610 [Polysphondylium violaceum]|uniref:Pleckstrin domain-containing protein n=1 Tax=Polysphondylium violaceum TaxID=133409 RepID=A0A8J4PR30_9MYCE|nr:hypothetical protein CYY_006610 [Polysphondylium violaceum]
MKSSSFLSKKRAAIKWIENVLECKIETNKDFIETLQDGVLICKVMQTISPRLMPRISIPDPNTPQRTILFKYSENVSFFIQACTDMGVPRHKRFALSDLVHSSNSSPSYTNMKRIIECLESVSKIANSDPQYEFSIEWPEIDQEEFSEEEIHQAEKLLAQFTIRESKRQEVIKKSQSNDVPSVEATKNQLFQHMAAQKQLYPDNSPQKVKPSSPSSSFNHHHPPLHPQPTTRPISHYYTIRPKSYSLSQINNNNNNNNNIPFSSSPPSSASPLSSSPNIFTPPASTTTTATASTTAPSSLSPISSPNFDDVICSPTTLSSPLLQPTTTVNDDHIVINNNNNNNNNNNDEGTSNNNAITAKEQPRPYSPTIELQKEPLSTPPTIQQKPTFKDILNKWKNPSYFSNDHRAVDLYNSNSSNSTIQPNRQRSFTMPHPISSSSSGSGNKMNENNNIDVYSNCNIKNNNNHYLSQKKEEEEKIATTTTTSPSSLNNSPKLDGVSNRNSLSSPIKLNPIFTAGANSTPTTTTTTTTTTNTTSSNTASVAPIPSNNSTSITSTTATVTPTTATPSKPTTPTRPITPSMEVIKERAAIKIQRATRKWLERNRQRVLARDAAYRERIVKEITETEEQYLDRMNYLKTVVLKDLRDAVNKGSPIISIEEIQTIFSEVEIIEAYNQKFLHDFKTRTANFKKDTMIGDIFIKFSQFLKIYSQYSRNYSEAMNALNECKKQSKFKSYLEKVKHDRPEIGLRGLEDYLIRPVQRIPRYSLLLKDMISHTWKSHPDYAQLEEAFQKMNSVAEYMNEKKKEAENMMKLAEIQEKLDGESSAVLAKSFRKFVKEGDFVEVLTKGKKAPIVIYLFNDSLAITRPTKSSGSSFFSKQKTIRLQFEQIFLLHQLTMKEYESVCGVANSLKLQSKKDSQISIVVATHDRDTLDEWIKAINAEKAEDEKNVKEQNDRISSSINEKVIATKQKIEEKFTRVSGQYSASDVESIGGRSDSSSTGSLSNSTDSTGESGGVPADLKSGKMSLRERRVRLAQESKNKRLSGHMAAMNSSTDLNDLK